MKKRRYFKGMNFAPRILLLFFGAMLAGCAAAVTYTSPVHITRPESWVNLMPGGKPSLHVNAVLTAPLLSADTLSFPIPTLGSVYQNGREVVSFTPQIVLVDSSVTDTGKVVSVEIISGALATFDGFDRSAPFLLRYVVRFGIVWYYPEREGITAEPVY